MLPGVLPSIALASWPTAWMVFLPLRAAFLADRDDRGLVEHDALAAHVDQRVGGAEVDREVGREVADGRTPNMGRKSSRGGLVSCCAERCGLSPSQRADAGRESKAAIITRSPVNSWSRSRANAFSRSPICFAHALRFPMALTPEDIAPHRPPRAPRTAPRRERARCSTQLNGFFGIVEQMRAVDTTGVEPLAHPLAAVADVSCACATTWSPRPTSATPTSAARRRSSDGLFLVPKVIE